MSKANRCEQVPQRSLHMDELAEETILICFPRVTKQSFLTLISFITVDNFVIEMFISWLHCNWYKRQTLSHTMRILCTNNDWNMFQQVTVFIFRSCGILRESCDTPRSSTATTARRSKQRLGIKSRWLTSAQEWQSTFTGFPNFSPNKQISSIFVQ